MSGSAQPGAPLCSFLPLHLSLLYMGLSWMVITPLSLLYMGPSWMGLSAYTPPGWSCQHTQLLPDGHVGVHGGVIHTVVGSIVHNVGGHVVGGVVQVGGVVHNGGGHTVVGGVVHVCRYTLVGAL
jgi:hypothetical protein